MEGKGRDRLSGGFTAHSFCLLPGTAAGVRRPGPGRGLSPVTPTPLLSSSSSSCRSSPPTPSSRTWVSEGRRESGSGGGGGGWNLLLATGKWQLERKITFWRLPRSEGRWSSPPALPHPRGPNPPGSAFRAARQPQLTGLGNTPKRRRGVALPPDGPS